MKSFCGIAIAVLLAGCFSATACAQAQMTVWKEFVADLHAGKITAERIRPYDESLRAPMLGFLAIMREKAPAQEWQVAPEAYRVGNQLHYLLPLTVDGHKVTYCFSFLTEGSNWYFQHLEAIFIRLDHTGAPPVSVFPDVSEEQKASMREEIAVSRQVELFNLLTQLKGKPFAFDWFRDGQGYFLAARAWVPFLPPARAFILYACWEQANLRGNRVTLEKLEDTEARVRMNLAYFRIYQEAAHLRPQISPEDYRSMFETIWQDRAQKAGWDLKLTCNGTECVLEFTRPPYCQPCAAQKGFDLRTNLFCHSGP